ncbi:DUF2188 domain-containing protein [Candidatus Saccharibacteria bacterium]|nr:MAG: DUF2188 domain-containing protein [Candidatus Saccharibacteria bacterium]
MAGKQVHTTYSKQAGNWRNVSAGSSRPAKVYDTKVQAQTAGRQQAINNKTEHVVHNQNGQIASRNSYGGDPHPPKG